MLPMIPKITKSLNFVCKRFQIFQDFWNLGIKIKFDKFFKIVKFGFLTFFFGNLNNLLMVLVRKFASTNENVSISMKIFKILSQLLSSLLNSQKLF